MLTLTLQLSVWLLLWCHQQLLCKAQGSAAEQRSLHGAYTLLRAVGLVRATGRWQGWGGLRGQCPRPGCLSLASQSRRLLSFSLLLVITQSNWALGFVIANFGAKGRPRGRRRGSSLVLIGQIRVTCPFSLVLPAAFSVQLVPDESPCQNRGSATCLTSDGTHCGTRYWNAFPALPSESCFHIHRRWPLWELGNVIQVHLGWSFVLCRCPPSPPSPLPSPSPRLSPLPPWWAFPVQCPWVLSSAHRSGRRGSIRYRATPFISQF